MAFLELNSLPYKPMNASLKALAFASTSLAFFCFLLQPDVALAQSGGDDSEARGEIPTLIAKIVSDIVEETRQRAEPGTAEGPIYFDSEGLDESLRWLSDGEDFGFDHDAFRAALPPKLRGQFQAGVKGKEALEKRSTRSPDGEAHYKIARNGISVGIPKVRDVSKERRRTEVFFPEITADYFLVACAFYSERREGKGDGEGLARLCTEYFAEKREDGRWKVWPRDEADK